MKLNKNVDKMQSLNNIDGFKPYMTRLSQNWLDVLVPFSNEYNRKFSVSGLPKITGIPLRSVCRYLVLLVNKNVLRFEEGGNNKFYYFDISDERVRSVLNLVESKNGGIGK